MAHFTEMRRCACGAEFEALSWHSTRCAPCQAAYRKEYAAKWRTMGARGGRPPRGVTLRHLASLIDDAWVKLICAYEVHDWHAVEREAYRLGAARGDRHATKWMVEHAKEQRDADAGS